MRMRRSIIFISQSRDAGDSSLLCMPHADPSSDVCTYVDIRTTVIRQILFVFMQVGWMASTSCHARTHARDLRASYPFFFLLFPPFPLLVSLTRGGRRRGYTDGIPIMFDRLGILLSSLGIRENGHVVKHSREKGKHNERIHSLLQGDEVRI